ncbi:hypothetical protein HU200_024679 [Digitaria exilis]|uniref:Uncharacterized protein n=1 Tax=Digitaria exilis TaxID=1010633 RepID=A0A835EW81_9POAL|nr:hypothetical protein HU200_024679 [Digitaria exilis]
MDCRLTVVCAAGAATTRKPRRRGGRRREGCSPPRRSRCAPGGTGRRAPPCRWRSGWAPASSRRPGTRSTTPPTEPCLSHHLQRPRRHRHRRLPSLAGSTSSPSSSSRHGSPWRPPRASPASCACPASRLPDAPPLPPLPCRTKKRTRTPPRRERRPGWASSAAGARLPLRLRPHHWDGSPRRHTCNRQEPSVRPPPMTAPGPRRDLSIDRPIDRSISNHGFPARRRRLTAAVVLVGI